MQGGTCWIVLRLLSVPGVDSGEVSVETAAVTMKVARARRGLTLRGADSGGVARGAPGGGASGVKRGAPGASGEGAVHRRTASKLESSRALELESFAYD